MSYISSICLLLILIIYLSCGDVFKHDHLCKIRDSLCVEGILNNLKVFTINISHLIDQVENKIVGKHALFCPLTHYYHHQINYNNSQWPNNKYHIKFSNRSVNLVCPSISFYFYNKKIILISFCRHLYFKFLKKDIMQHLFIIIS